MPHRMRTGLSDTPPSSPLKASISKTCLRLPLAARFFSHYSSLLVYTLVVTSPVLAADFPPSYELSWCSRAEIGVPLDDAIPKQRTSVASHAEHGQHCRLARQPTLPPTCSRHRILDCHPLLGSVCRLASTDQLGEAEVDVACQGLRPGDDGRLVR